MTHEKEASDEFLKILFYVRNQIYHKIAWGLSGGFLSIHLSFAANNSHFLERSNIVYNFEENK